MAVNFFYFILFFYAKTRAAAARAYTRSSRKLINVKGRDICRPNKTGGIINKARGGSLEERDVVSICEGEIIRG